MIRPGLYCDAEGLLAVAETRNDEVVMVRVPLDLAGLQDAAERILAAVRAMRRAQVAPAGERPKVTALGGAQCN